MNYVMPILTKTIESLKMIAEVVNQPMTNRSGSAPIYQTNKQTTLFNLGNGQIYLARSQEWSV